MVPRKPIGFCIRMRRAFNPGGPPKYTKDRYIDLFSVGMSEECVNTVEEYEVKNSSDPCPPDRVYSYMSFTEAKIAVAVDVDLYYVRAPRFGDFKYVEVYVEEEEYYVRYTESKNAKKGEVVWMTRSKETAYQLAEKLEVRLNLEYISPPMEQSSKRSRTE